MWHPYLNLIVIVIFLVFSWSYCGLGMSRKLYCFKLPEPDFFTFQVLFLSLMAFFDLKMVCNVYSVALNLMCLLQQKAARFSTMLIVFIQSKKNNIYIFLMNIH